jgi:hypothetical protein
MTKGRGALPWRVAAVGSRTGFHPLGDDGRKSSHNTIYLDLAIIPRGLDFFRRLRNHRCRGLKTYLGMGSVAEWLVDRCSAAAKRDSRLTTQIQYLAIAVHQLDGTLYAKRSVRSHRDCYFTLSHARTPVQRYEFDSSLEQFRNYCGIKKIARCGFPWEKTT